jgi:serine/threonine protein kinase
MGQYDLLEVLGKGGMGTVYRGRHQKTGQIVAVKVLAVETTLDPTLVRRFEQECAAANRLHHPHIVQGLDFGVEAGRPYLVMEFVDGPNLRQQVKQHGPLPQAAGVGVILQIAEALHLAHSVQLIHRDVKPDNILLGVDGQAKLTDLGLLKDLNAGADVTRSRTCLGTIDFMAPEQFADAKHVDHRCDVFSLAASLYFALTGVVPFKGRGNLTVQRKKLKNEYVPPRVLVPTLHVQVEQAICRAIDAAPARRPRSCKEFARLLSASQPKAAAGAAEYQRILRANQKATYRGRFEDRRVACRYPSALDASCRPAMGGQQHWSAEIEDISVTGVRLQLDRRVEPGSVLCVDVVLEPSQAVSSWLVRVRWVRQVASRRYSLGCSFNRNLSESELHTLLENRSSTVVVHPRAI